MVGAVIFTACATDNPAKKATVAQITPTGADENFIVTAIEDSALPKGSCGMVLWTLDAEQPTPVFRAIIEKGAEISIDGAPVKMALTKVDGSANYGVFELQTFEGEGLSAHIKVRFGQGFDGGSYVEHGIMTIEREDGWRTVVPAAGIAGCRAK